MSEQEFANIYESIGSGERAEELNLAHQGQLHDIMSPNTEKQESVSLSEEVVL